MLYIKKTEIYQKLKFRKPVKFEMRESGGDQVIAFQKQIIVIADNASIKHDLVPILAMAKLGEINPLFATLTFKKGTEEDPQLVKYAQDMKVSVMPLQDAWAYNILKQYAPALYDEEISDIVKMVDTCLSHNIPLDDIQQIRLWAIMQTQNIYRVDSPNGLPKAYTDTLQRAAMHRPSVKLMSKLANTRAVGYRVLGSRHVFKIII